MKMGGRKVAAGPRLKKGAFAISERSFYWWMTLLRFLVGEILFHVRADWLVGAAFALERPGFGGKEPARMSAATPKIFCARRAVSHSRAVSWRSLFCKVVKDEAHRS